MNKLTLDKIKAVIFDIDGTIIDSMPIWQDVSARYLRSIGIIPEPNLSEIVFSMTIKEGCHYTKEHYNLSMSEEEIENGIIELIKNFYYYEAVAKPGVVKLVNELKKNNIPMVLATTGDMDLASHALMRLGIWDLFIKLFECGKYNTSKRETKIFMLAKEELENAIGYKVDFKDIYVFEDSPVAINTTKNMGFTVVGIADNACEKEWDAIESKADYFCHSLEEIV